MLLYVMLLGQVDVGARTLQSHGLELSWWSLTLNASNSQFTRLAESVALAGGVLRAFVGVSYMHDYAAWNTSLKHLRNAIPELPLYLPRSKHTAINLSHFLLLLHLIETQATGAAIILEQDAELRQHFVSNVLTVLRAVPDDWAFINLNTMRPYGEIVSHVHLTLPYNRTDHSFPIYKWATGPALSGNLGCYISPRDRMKTPTGNPMMNVLSHASIHRVASISRIFKAIRRMFAEDARQRCSTVACHYTIQYDFSQTYDRVFQEAVRRFGDRESYAAYGLDIPTELCDHRGRQLLGQMRFPLHLGPGAPVPFGLSAAPERLCEELLRWGNAKKGFCYEPLAVQLNKIWTGSHLMMNSRTGRVYKYESSDQP